MTNKQPLLRRLAVATALLALCAPALAQEEGEAQSSSVFPVEMYVCNFHEGKGNADLDQWATKWNAWADGTLDPYSAWTVTPFY